MGDARNEAVESIKHDGETDRARRVIQIDDPALHRSQNGVKSAQQIADGKCAGQEINAASQPMIPRLDKSEFFLVRFFHRHRASTLTPPDTCWPGRATISASCGSQTSVREPNRISPIRSPNFTVSPGAFQQTTRRAMAPAICLKTISPRSVSR